MFFSGHHIAWSDQSMAISENVRKKRMFKPKVNELPIQTSRRCSVSFQIRKFAAGCLCISPARTLHMNICTEMRFILCKSCLAGPRQSQAEQLSKSRKKFHQTTYKEIISTLYYCNVSPGFSSARGVNTRLWHEMFTLCEIGGARGQSVRQKLR